MWGLSLVAGFLISWAYIMSANMATAAANAVIARSKAYGGNMSSYAYFLNKYAVANPGYVGTVSDSTAALPTWFQRFPDVSGYVTSGKAYVYYVPLSTSDGYSIATEIGDGVPAGVVMAGIVHVPGKSAATVAVPSQVPNGAVVVVD